MSVVWIHPQRQYSQQIPKQNQKSYPQQIKAQQQLLLQRGKPTHSLATTQQGLKVSKRMNQMQKQSQPKTMNLFQAKDKTETQPIMNLNIKQSYHTYIQESISQIYQIFFELVLKSSPLKCHSKQDYPQQQPLLKEDHRRTKAKSRMIKQLTSHQICQNSIQNLSIKVCNSYFQEFFSRQFQMATFIQCLLMMVVQEVYFFGILCLERNKQVPQQLGKTQDYMLSFFLIPNYIDQVHILQKRIQVSRLQQLKIHQALKQVTVLLHPFSLMKTNQLISSPDNSKQMASQFQQQLAQQLPSKSHN